MKVVVNKMFAFSSNGIGGNPAGVVIDADKFSPEQKQTIAQRVGLSETAFVSNSITADFKLDFFTPNRQIAHCGHATVATFSYLNSKGLIAGDRSSKETIDGNRDIFFRDGMAFMEQKVPIFKNVRIDQEVILKSLGINPEDLEKSPLEIVNTGNSFLIIAVKNIGVLKNIIPNQDLIEKYSDLHDLIGYYVFADTDEQDATTRMFAPRYGIAEEAATGMAAGPLAGYLYQHNDNPKTEYQFAQGEFMNTPSPSRINVQLDLDGNKINKLYAGGYAHVGAKIEVEI